jgi:hypothetical protein
MLTLVEGLSIRIFAYAAPKKGVIDGLKRGEEVFRRFCSTRGSTARQTESGCFCLPQALPSTL